MRSPPALTAAAPHAPAAPARSLDASPSDALQLRHWALEVLAAGGARTPPAPGSHVEIATIATGTWQLFLTAERCALPLRSRLAAAGMLALLPPPAQDLLEEKASGELQRVMMARSQLRELATLARSGGWQVIVLKGGVAARTDDPLYLHDVDLLLGPEAADAFAAALDRLGYAAAGYAGPKHLSPRVAPDSLQIEVHVTTESSGAMLDDGVFARAVPLDSLVGLSRLAPPDHLWHVLVHAVVDHPYRRGRLRDVLLIGAAVADCSDAELHEVERRCSAHESAAPLLALLTAARAVHAGAQVRDPFTTVAAANYVLQRLAAGRGWPGIVTRPLAEALSAVLGGPPARRKLWALTWSDAPSPSHRLTAWAERASPRLGRWWRMTLRLGRLVPVCAVAVLVTAIGAQLARRQAHRPAARGS